MLAVGPPASIQRWFRRAGRGSLAKDRPESAPLQKRVQAKPGSRGKRGHGDKGIGGERDLARGQRQGQPDGETRLLNTRAPR